jgi:hypothetical protein
MTSPRWPEIMYRILPAAEQAAHPKSGPRRRPHELPKSFRTHGDSRRTTHITRSPTEPVRFIARLGRAHDRPDRTHALRDLSELLRQKLNLPPLVRLRD